MMNAEFAVMGTLRRTTYAANLVTPYCAFALSTPITPQIFSRPTLPIRIVFAIFMRRLPRTLAFPTAKTRFRNTAGNHFINIAALFTNAFYMFYGSSSTFRAAKTACAVMCRGWSELERLSTYFTDSRNSISALPLGIARLATKMVCTSFELIRGFEKTRAAPFTSCIRFMIAVLPSDTAFTATKYVDVLLQVPRRFIAKLFTPVTQHLRHSHHRIQFYQNFAQMPNMKAFVQGGA